MNEKIRDDVYNYAMENILEALENGDPMEAAAAIREGIRSGWSAALLDSGMPEEMQAKLRFPL